MQTKFRKLEDVWDLLNEADKDILSAGLESLLGEYGIYKPPYNQQRVTELWNFTVNN